MRTHLAASLLSLSLSLSVAGAGCTSGPRRVVAAQPPVDPPCTMPEAVAVAPLTSADTDVEVVVVRGGEALDLVGNAMLVTHRFEGLTTMAPIGWRSPRRGVRWIHDTARDRLLAVGGWEEVAGARQRRTDVIGIERASGRVETVVASGAPLTNGSMLQAYDAERDRVVLWTQEGDVWELPLGAEPAWHRLASGASAPRPTGADGWAIASADYDAVKGRFVGLFATADGRAELHALALSSMPVLGWERLGTAGGLAPGRTALLVDERGAGLIATLMPTGLSVARVDLGASPTVTPLYVAAGALAPNTTPIYRRATDELGLVSIGAGEVRLSMTSLSECTSETP